MATDFHQASLCHFMHDPGAYLESPLKGIHYPGTINSQIHEWIGELIARGEEPTPVNIATCYPETPAAIEASRIFDIQGKPSLSFCEKKILDQYKNRKIKEIISHVSASGPASDPAETMELIQQKLSEAEDIQGGDRIHSLNEVAGEGFKALMDRHEKGGEILGIPSGLRRLDSYLLGWQPSRYYCIGARPSQGKSALILQMAIHAATRGIRIGMLSLESDKKELYNRMLSQISGISATAIQTGAFGKKAYDPIQEAHKKMEGLPIEIYDRPNQTLPEVKSQARQMVKFRGCKIIFVDYLQLVSSPKAKDRREAVEKASLALKQLARELKVPIVVAAQLGRSADNGRPSMGHVQWSSQVEQDADAVVLIHIDKDQMEEAQPQVELILAKNRDGARGTIRMEFEREIVSFREAV